VKLQNGRVIAVKVKRKFERQDRSSQYTQTIMRGTSVTFDAGVGVGEFTFEVDRNIAMIDQHLGIWYFLITSDLPQFIKLPHIAHSGLRLVQLKGREIVANRHSRELPKEFKDLNLMHLTGDRIMSQYDGKYVTLADKVENRMKNNTPGHDREIVLTQCAMESKC
jgi:hypothetical protein